MLKNVLLLLSLVCIAGCKTEPKSATETETPSEERTTRDTTHTVPQFDNLEDMFAYADDYTEENGTLKIINGDQLNATIRVSTTVLATDSDNVKEETAKRDIIYVVFQTFAQTDIDQLTVTSIPIDLNEAATYYDNFKKTLTVTRARAKATLETFLDSEDFAILFEHKGLIWLPNKNFHHLILDRLDDVYKELSK